MREPAALTIARCFWQRDEPAPLHIVARLIELGFDVPTLEQQYRP